MVISFRLSVVARWFIYFAVGLSLVASSRDLGPVSLKVYPVLALFLLLGISFLKDKNFLSNFTQGTLLIFLWGVFLFWKVIASCLNGSDVVFFMRELFAMDIVAFIMFMAIVYFFRTEEEVRRLGFFILLVTLISIVIGFFQWLDYVWAWDLQELLNPNVGMNYEQVPSKYLINGLASHAFILGYYLAGAALFLLPYSFMAKKKFFYSILFLIVMCALLILQQRGAVVSTVAGGVIFFCYYRNKFEKNIFTALVLFGLSSIVFAALFQSGFFDIGRYAIARVSDLHDDNRLELVRNSLGYFEQAFLWGIPRMQFIRESYITVAPHNLFLNAFVFYGFTGLVLSIGMVILLIRLIMSVMKIALSRNDPLGVGLVLVIAGQLMNSLFHNASIISGFFFIWWFVALAVIYRRLYACRSVEGDK